MNFLFWEITLRKTEWKREADAGRRIVAVKKLKDSGYGSLQVCVDRVKKYLKVDKLND